MARSELAGGDSWAAVRERKIAEIDVLPRSMSILAILRIINNHENNRTVTLWRHLQGIAYIAHQPEFKQRDCRLFKSFADPADDNRSNGPDRRTWLLDFAESYGYLRQMGYIDRLVHVGHWFLTRAGAEALDNHIERNGVLPVQADEVETVLAASERVRVGLDLGRHLIPAESRRYMDFST